MFLLDTHGQSCRILTTDDQKDYVLGTNFAFTQEKSFSEQCRELICIACLHPMVGVPRRPLRVTMKDPLSAEKAVGLDVSDYGITYMYAGVDHVTTEQPVRMRECCVCHLRGSNSSCQAMLYCSKACQKADWDRKGPMAPHSHKQWCKKMKGELPDTEDLIVLPVESTVLDNEPDKSAGQLQDWESYYTFRGLRLDSPVAILLQWPLTLYHVINHCLPNDTGSWWEDLDDTLKIDILGVEKEADMLPIFKELAFLCPDLSLDIHMYGNEISKAVDGREYKNCNLQIKVIRGLYHRKSSTARKPQVAVGYNAGIGAYQQWSQTLVKLRTDKTPAYFTDYCQYSCECARIAVEGLGLGTTSEPVINPFRNPVRKLATENDMPWYSNGFLYHLVYP